MGPQNNETDSALNKGFSGGLFIAMLSLIIFSSYSYHYCFCLEYSGCLA